MNTVFLGIQCLQNLNLMKSRFMILGYIELILWSVEQCLREVSQIMFTFFLKFWSQLLELFCF